MLCLHRILNFIDTHPQFLEESINPSAITSYPKIRITRNSSQLHQFFVDILNMSERIEARANRKL
jgi:hypothetical protein